MLMLSAAITSRNSRGDLTVASTLVQVRHKSTKSSL